VLVYDSEDNIGIGIDELIEDHQSHEPPQRNRTAEIFIQIRTAAGAEAIPHSYLTRKAAVAVRTPVRTQYGTKTAAAERRTRSGMITSVDPDLR
jgi:hypothetical protein